VCEKGWRKKFEHLVRVQLQLEQSTYYCWRKKVSHLFAALKASKLPSEQKITYFSFLFLSFFFASKAKTERQPSDSCIGYLLLKIASILNF
jgi:hypothetical protein